MDIGLVGLAVMGRNLALNLMDKGFAVAGFDVDGDCLETCSLDPRFRDESFQLFSDLDTFVTALNPPRILLLMIKAGDPVDQILARLRSILHRGDVVIDGGNSHFADTIRREREMTGYGIHFLGAGISGGSMGARHGPAIMLGGGECPLPLWRVLLAVVARYQSEPCLVHAGTDGAGHFVKMVHNGIEYADMQLLAESQFLLQNLLGLNYADQASIFDSWNQGELSGYLTAITAKIVRKTDPRTGKPALNVISDEAGHKGTGQWAAQAAMELGVSVPNLIQAVDARLMSGMRFEREAVQARWPVQPLSVTKTEKERVILALADILLAARIIVFAQGFKLLAVASRHFNWSLDLGAISACWRAGCILQGTMPERVRHAFSVNPGLEHLLLDPDLGQRAADGFHRGRTVVTMALSQELPVSGLATALQYFDAFRHRHLWTRVIAAQRDCFGAHGFARTDMKERDSWDWS